MASISDPLVGHVLDGRYRITDRLARGGMATVYRATDTRLTRTVAVKVMHSGLGDDAEFARKFDREARAAARLSHPNVVSVFDQGVDDLGHGESRPYIVMEYVEGQTLRNVISRQAPLTPLRALELMEPVLSALAAAHNAGLVHRDVKPENVLISDRGQVKVADFGLAKAISAQTSTATQGLLIGTVSYLPPELVVSGRADARSDVYSAGVVLFELLTGRKPHTGETPIQVAYAHVHTDVPAVSSMSTAGPIPPYLDALIARFTARNADARPPDARVMLTQLRRVRTALSEGLSDDPELTQDLTVPLNQLPPAPTPDPADFEVTSFVQPAPDPVFEPDWRPEPGWDDRTGPVRPSGGWQEPSVPYNVHSLSTPSRPIRPSDRDRDLPRRPESELAEVRSAAAERYAVRARRRRFRGWLIMLVVLVLAILAAYTGWYLTKGRFTTAPALTSLTQPQAQSAVDQAGLSVHFSEAYSESVSAGAVISTDPGAGAKIRDGAEMEAVVSKGPERYAMPTVAGLTQAQAQAALESAHLAVGKISSAYADKITKGVVISAGQSVGTRLRPDTVVALTVSAGPKPIKITDYTGKSADDAVKALEKAGFKVTITTQNSDEVGKGKVISQSPKDGNGVKGDEIALTKSLGPVLVTVPSVRAYGVKSATAKLEAAGFKVAQHKARTNYLGLGFVAYTDPSGGSQAPKGSTIGIYLI